MLRGARFVSGVLDRGSGLADKLSNGGGDHCRRKRRRSWNACELPTVQGLRAKFACLTSGARPITIGDVCTPLPADVSSASGFSYVRRIANPRDHSRMDLT